MVVETFDSTGLQSLTELFTRAPFETVDDPRLFLVSIDQIQDFGDMVHVIRLLALDLHYDVRSIERALEYGKVFREPQSLGQLLPDLDCGGCCQTKYWHGGIALLKFIHFFVGWSEVITPILDAMHLIEDKSCD